jgi:CheY-like chemotaxis protein
MGTHILLIDDDPDDADIFSDAIRDLDPDIKLVHFENGLQALESLTFKAAPLPQIIFLDIKMPLVTGWECLRAIKALAHLQNIPIVMYSTSNLTSETIEAKNIGASAFLTKPSNYADLKKALSQLLHKFA